MPPNPVTRFSDAARVAYSTTATRTSAIHSQENWKSTASVSTSHLLAVGPPEEPGRPHEEDEDQEQERERVLPLGRDVRREQVLGDAEEEPADHGPGDGADAPEDRRDERLEARHEAGERIDLAVLRAERDAPEAREERAEEERRGDHAVDVDAHEPRGGVVLGDGPHGLPHAGLTHEEPEDDRRDPEHHDDRAVDDQPRDVALPEERRPSALREALARRLGHRLALGDDELLAVDGLTARRPERADLVVVGVRRRRHVGDARPEPRRGPRPLRRPDHVPLAREVLEEEREPDGGEQRRDAPRAADRPVADPVGHHRERRRDERAGRERREIGDDDRPRLRNRELLDPRVAQHEVARERTRHEQLAVGEVDETDDAVDHRVAERDEGVDRAAAEPVGEVVDEVLPSADVAGEEAGDDVGEDRPGDGPAEDSRPGTHRHSGWIFSTNWKVPDARTITTAFLGVRSGPMTILPVTPLKESPRRASARSFGEGFFPP